MDCGSVIRGFKSRHSPFIFVDKIKFYLFWNFDGLEIYWYCLVKVLNITSSLERIFIEVLKNY